MQMPETNLREASHVDDWYEERCGHDYVRPDTGYCLDCGRQVHEATA